MTQILCRRILSGAVLALVLTAAPAFAQFTNIANSAPLNDSGAGFGVSWVDFDSDGDLDVYLTNGTVPNRMLRNDGNWAFHNANIPELAGTGGEYGAFWADYDNDEDIDVYVCNGISPSVLCRNEGGEIFVTAPPGAAGGYGPAQSGAWSDYDQDGDVDLYVTYYNSPNRLYRNDAGVFVDATPALLAIQAASRAATWADYDNDGDPDLFVAATVGSKLLRNEGGGVFVDDTGPVFAKAGINAGVWGDYDNDGDLDLYLARDQVSNRLLRNETAGGVTSFIDIFYNPVRDTGISQTAVWFDYNNDGNLDLFVANAGINNGVGASNTLIRANGGGSFTDVTTGIIAELGNSRGAAAGDLDNNGFPDLYVVNWYGPNQMLRNGNAGNGNRWLQIDLRGTESNRSAIGARIRVVAGSLSQIREISGGTGLYSQDALRASFGLGTHTTVDSVIVTWPSGTVTDSVNVATNQRIELFETSVQVGIGDGPVLPPISRLYANTPNPFRANTVIRYDILEPTPVDLRVLDFAGRLVRTVERGTLREPGSYEATWDGRNEAGTRMPQGIYFYSLNTRNGREARRMVLLR